MREYFRKIAQAAAAALGSAWAFIASIVLVLVWVVTGPIFHFSDTWQLIINTVTNLITFWMVFIIQNSQNRDSKAMLLKLDELIRTSAGARNQLMNLESVDEKEFERLEGEFQRLRVKFGHTGSVVPPEALRREGS
ncbi:MAG: low affinity iron permease family protein [Acidobacteriota bacterium]|nr:low affinity iron permease family protein [Acidobacteriota bacterium]